MNASATKVYVFPVPARADDVKTLKQLIEQAGCVLVCDEANADEFAQCVEAADVVVILICPETMDDELVKQVVELANRLGKRIVGVWAPDVDDARLPTVLHRHGDATIIFNSEEIRQHICQSAPVWTTPEGQPRPKPKTPRHKG